MLDPNPLPSEDRRRAIFAALVEVQERTRSVRTAKQEVVAQFDVTGAVVGRIEQEGMNNEWPPLDDAD